MASATASASMSAAIAGTSTSLRSTSLKPASTQQLRCAPAAAGPSIGASGRALRLVTVRADAGGPVKQAKQAVDSATKVPVTRDGVLKHQEENESEKRSVLGTVPSSGGSFPRAEIDRRPETGDASLASQMAFDGAAPETINGRLAMAGFLWAVVAEATTHQSVLEQVSAPGSRGLVYFLGLAQLLAYASLVPILKGESPDSRRWGPFNAKAERWNGRLAMLGFAGLVVVEAALGGALINALPFAS